MTIRPFRTSIPRGRPCLICGRVPRVLLRLGAAVLLAIATEASAGDQPDMLIRRGVSDANTRDVPRDVATSTLPSIYNQPVANLTTNSAVFHGWLVDTSGVPATVCVLWGVNTNAWAHTNWWSPGAWTNDTYPETSITGLARSTTYYYTFGASNEAGLAVADAPVSFTTFGIRGAWWQNPVLKYKEDTGTAATGAGPHFMNKDESDQYLFLPVGFYPSHKGVLYRMSALVNATNGNEVAPVISAASADLFGADWDYAWRGGAVSDDRGRIMPGNFQKNHNTSLPCSSPWTKAVTAFEITNDIPTSMVSGLDFSHDSAKLYSVALPGPSFGSNIYTWLVGDLRRNGTGLTSNTIFTTSLTQIENVSVYFIGGKDLVYYGEANPGGKVCVYDPAAGTETVLIANGLPASPIMNVKVGGVNVGQMHLYVQMDSGALQVYDLAADGKSVGAIVRSFTDAEVRLLLNITPIPSPFNIRSFEVTDDETHAFFSHHWGNSGPSANNILVYVVWSGPRTTNGTSPAWLAQFGLTDYENDDLIDQDGDGLFTWQEYLAGTDPTNPASAFAVLDIAMMSASNRVTFYGTTNGATLPFKVYRATNLVSGVGWDFRDAIDRNPSGTNVWWDTAPPPTATPVFYRPVATGP